MSARLAHCHTFRLGRYTVEVSLPRPEPNETVLTVFVLRPAPLAPLKPQQERRLYAGIERAVELISAEFDEPMRPDTSRLQWLTNCAQRAD